MTLDPNSHKSRILAPGMHCVINPSKVKLTILEASWYLVQTSLFLFVCLFDVLNVGMYDESVCVAIGI